MPGRKVKEIAPSYASDNLNRELFAKWLGRRVRIVQGAGGVGGLLAVYEHTNQIDSTATASADDREGVQAYYPTYDGNGNVTQYIDASGTTAAHYQYDAFGNTVASSGSKREDFSHRFSTKPYETETEWYYYGYRYYDPVTGKWPSRDPIAEDGGINLYGFVRNDGVNYLDVLGLDPVGQIPPSGFDLPSPGGGDQINPFGLRGNSGNKDYKKWFEYRFPKTISGSKSLLESRITNHIKTKYCFKKAHTFNPLEIKGPGGEDFSDVDINPNMQRFGDRPQGRFMRRIELGFFELKFENVKIKWDNKTCCFSYTGNMYVLEQTGVGEGEPEDFLEPLAGKRFVRMGNWAISGKSCCPKSKK